jgi:Patatin-like phospholipase
VREAVEARRSTANGLDASRSVDLDEMLASEKAHVARLRDGDLQRMVAPDDFFGLALSGGGIRSATFSLGVVQALAQRGLLRRIDYLSTVSGGGYIGSWLSACIYHARINGKNDPLAAIEKSISPKSIRTDDVEPTEVRFLRAYSSYLTPRLGPLSGDTLALLAGLLRNLGLNLFLGVVSISWALAFIHLMIAVGLAVSQVNHSRVGFIFAAYFLYAVCFISMFLTLQSFDIRNVKDKNKKKFLIDFQRGTPWMTIPPLAISLMVIGIWFALAAWPIGSLGIIVATALVLFFSVVGTIIAHFLLFRSGESASDSDVARRIDVFSRLKIYSGKVFQANSLRHFGATVACAMGGYAFVAFGPLSHVQGHIDLGRIVLSVAFGPALAAAGFWLLYLLWMGIVGNLYSEFTREWFNRLLGELTRLAGLWLVGGGIILHARPAWEWIKVNWTRLYEGNALFVAIGAALTGFVLGIALHSLGAAQQSLNPASALMSNSRRLAMSLMSWLVLLVVVAALTVLYQHELVALSPPYNALAFENYAPYSEIISRHFYELASGLSFDKESSTWWRVMPTLTLFGALTLLASIGFLCIDVNTFSIQNLYRNRLVRCYLGAANHEKRLPNPYAGFDPKDDLELVKFAEQRPYLLINAALNLTQGQDLAWQQRKAASFVFSPRWCGYWLESTETTSVVSRNGDLRGGYVRTEDFVHEPGVSLGVMVGAAMATSGAAVSSQMGFASRETRAFLLTLLNMRLGRWLPNPAIPSNEALWKRSTPRFAAFCYLRELFGMTNERSKWIYASDGGHFENLGIYELVRRRCRLVICVDAGADPKRSFGDLGNAIQKCRVDFGVNIAIDTQPLSIDASDGRSENAYSVGTIDYPATRHFTPFRGTFIYIKPSIPKGWDQLPTDILSYRVRHPEFPHEPTREQWFTESQFESYRQLGCVIGYMVFQDARIG